MDKSLDQRLQWRRYRVRKRYTKWRCESVTREGRIPLNSDEHGCQAKKGGYCKTLLSWGSNMVTAIEVESCLLGAGLGNGMTLSGTVSPTWDEWVPHICHTALCLVNDDISCCLMLWSESNGGKSWNWGGLYAMLAGSRSNWTLSPAAGGSSHGKVTLKTAWQLFSKLNIERAFVLPTVLLGICDRERWPLSTQGHAHGCSQQLHS